MDKGTTNDDFFRRIIVEKVNSTLEEPLSASINESESNVHEIIAKLDLRSIEEHIPRSAELDPWLINLNHYDYATIIDGLNSNSTATKIKILDKLLSSQIIDTKQDIWANLSQTLRKCFVSVSNDVFNRSLKIHHRIIAFPNTASDGYLNLLKSTVLLLNSRYFNDLNKSRIIQSLQLILETQGVVLKILLHANRIVVHEIITAFLTVLTFKSVFEFLSALDPQHTWLRNFCYGSYIRNALFNTLKEKNPDFVKHIVATFTKKLSGSEDASNYASFLLYFWQYKSNVDFLSPEDTLEITLTKFNQRKKLELFEIVVSLFANNPYLLTPKLLDVLVEPLFTFNRNNVRNSIESHKYIITIITRIANSPNFKVLFGPCANLKRGRSRQLAKNYTNLPQRIIDVTFILLRMNPLHNETVTLLLDCCASIYKSHPISFIHVNPTNLLQNLHDFYRLNWKTDVTIKGALLTLVEFFYAWYGPTVRILGSDNEILADLLAFRLSGEFRLVLCRIGGDKEGFEFVKSRHKQIVSPHLEKIWSCEDIEGLELTSFVFLLFVLKMSTRCVVALLSDDDDDTTVVESDDRSVNLMELVEKTLNDCVDSDEEFLGLMTMKVLIVNLDLLLYLQANHQMQEKLAAMKEAEEIVDAQSTLRNNILISLECVGFAREIATEATTLQDLLQIFESFHFNEENELRSILNSGGDGGEFSWVTQVRRAFRNSMDAFDPLLFPLLLHSIPKTYVYRKMELHWPPSDSVYYQLHLEDFCGISLIISFGHKSGLLKLEQRDTQRENLTLLIKQSRAFINHQPEHFVGFDWFVAIIYLITRGNFEQCRSTLIDVTNTPVTSLVWATFGREFDAVLQENFYQHLSVVLEENCSCFQALKLLGIAPDILVQLWLNQCFFNCLKFEEICNFLMFSVLYPVEYLIYYFVAVFEHLNNRISAATHTLDTESILKMTDLSDFKLSEHMELIDRLMKHYRNSHRLQ